MMNQKLHNLFDQLYDELNKEVNQTLPARPIVRRVARPIDPKRIIDFSRAIEDKGISDKDIFEYLEKKSDVLVFEKRINNEMLGFFSNKTGNK